MLIWSFFFFFFLYTLTPANLKSWSIIVVDCVLEDYALRNTSTLFYLITNAQYTQIFPKDQYSYIIKEINI